MHARPTPRGRGRNPQWNHLVPYSHTSTSPARSLERSLVPVRLARSGRRGQSSPLGIPGDLSSHRHSLRDAKAAPSPHSTSSPVRLRMSAAHMRTRADGHERDVTLLGMSVRALMGIRVRSRPIGIMSEGMATRSQPWRCQRRRGSPHCGAVALTERNMQTAADVGPAS